MRFHKFIYICCLCVVFCTTLAHATVPASGERVFDIYLGDKKIGQHQLNFHENEKGETIINIDIEMVYRIAFVPVFRYEHSNREVWRGETLLSIDSTTNDNGDKYYVRAETRGGVLIVDSSYGQYEVPTGTLSTSYWLEDIVQQKQLINTQDGKLIEIDDITVLDDTLATVIQDFPALKYMITGDLVADLWYDKAERTWIGLDFAIDGNRITYALVDPAQQGEDTANQKNIQATNETPQYDTSSDTDSR